MFRAEGFNYLARAISEQIKMSAHVLLLFDPENASNQQESPIASELERAGYEIMEANDLNTAAALLYVSRRVEAVVVAGNGKIDPEFTQCVTAIRPGLPLLLSEQVLVSDQQAHTNETSTETMDVVTVH